MNQATKPFIGKRILAGFIDYIIIYSFTFIIISAYGEANAEGVYELNGWPAFIPISFWGIMTVGFEQWFGATIGNSIVMLKPISILSNQRPSFAQSFQRHLLDPIDMFFLGLVGIIAIKNSRQHQRLGDQVAKTIVVKMTKEETK